MVNQGILDGIRILDFTWVLAGPYATRMLADFGAEVIKIQPLLPEADDEFARGYYNTWNRNKLGITLNLDKRQGLELAGRLTGISDVVAENFTPRVMANWGLDYENLKKIKPDIIMLSLSMMGNSGPLRDYVGFGPTAQAFSGITYLTSYPDKPPMGPGFSYADHIAGLTASLAVLNALQHRRQTGEGQYIDLSEAETMTSLMGNSVLNYDLTGEPPEPTGNRSEEACPHGVYLCRGEDRWCAISVSTEAEWLGFKNALGNPAWTEDREFSTLSGRLKNTVKLDRLVEEWTKARTAEEVMTRLQEHEVAAGVVQSTDDLASDPQLKARDFFIEMNHPELGKTVADANPVKLSDTPPEYKRPAPLPGQDNDYVYGKLLGLSGKEISELKEQGVI